MRLPSSTRTVLFLTLILAGCRPHATDEPETRTVDLTPRLPAGVQAPAGDAAPEHRAELSVGPDSDAVTIRWSAFQVGASRYLRSVSVDVPAGVRVRVTRFEAGAPINTGASAAATYAAPVLVGWERREMLRKQSGVASGIISADGRWLR